MYSGRKRTLILGYITVRGEEKVEKGKGKQGGKESV
jgi:hypothetical protein